MSNILCLTIYLYWNIGNVISKNQIWRYLNIIKPVSVQVLSKNENDSLRECLKIFFQQPILVVKKGKSTYEFHINFNTK